MANTNLLVALVLLVQLAAAKLTAAEPFDKDHDPFRSPNFKIAPVSPRAAASFLRRVSRFGLPTTDNLKLSENYVLAYDRRLKQPAFVMEHLSDKQMRIVKGDRNSSFFTEDSEVHEYFRATNDDYMETEYDRGHMSPASDNKVSQRVMDQSFSLSNIVAQLPGLNRGAWVRLERYVQHSAARSKNIYIVTGPLYLPKLVDGKWRVEYEVIGANKIGVPTHFYKVWVREDHNKRLHLEAFLLPNSHQVTRDSMLEQFRFDVDKLDEIERASGLIFFPKLDRSKLLKPTKLQCGYVDEKVLFKADLEAAKEAAVAAPA